MVSVIIPAYRPPLPALQRVLAGLRRQTALPQVSEVILVDNNSPGDYECALDASGLPGWRFIVEATPGLTPNRWRGFREASPDSEWILLVDQDNVLDADYLERGLRLAESHPWIGAMGGAIIPEYEAGRPPFAERAPSILSLRQVAKDVWSNDPGHGDSTPWGAGMLLRREVVAAYVRKLGQDARRAFLDHRGNDLLYGADNDLANSALEIGLGKGVFPELRLTHLIPPNRCAWDYFSRSVEGRIVSGYVMDYLERGNRPKSPGLKDLLRELVRSLSTDPFVRLTARAHRRARLRASALLEQDADKSLVSPTHG